MKQLFRIGSITASLLLASTGFGSSDAEIFRSTVKHVDMDGTMLNYMNTKRLIKTVEELPDIANKVLDPQKKNTNIQLGVTVAKAVLQTLSLNRLQAQAASSRQLSEQLFIFKSFLRFDQTPGLFQIFGQKNQPLKSLQTLPEDTRIALSLDFSPQVFWALLSAEAKQTNNPQITGTIASVQGIFEMSTQVRLDDLLSALQGKWELLAYGTPDNYGIKITIPDKNQILSKLLRNQLQLPPQTMRYTIPLDTVSPMFAPEIYFERNTITAVSNPKVLTYLQGVKNNDLLKKSEFAKMMSILPKTGINYAVLNFDPAFMEALHKFLPAEVVAPLCNLTQNFTFYLCGVDGWEKGGFKSIVASNVSLPEVAVFAGPVMSSLGTILPALNKARHQARNVSAAANLKNLHLGLEHYAAKHQGKYPPKLSDLKDFTTPKTLKCPVTNQQYVYITGYTDVKEKNSSRLPVAFSVPHNTQTVPVLFLDGHVELINLGKTYCDKNQLIDHLGSQGKLSAEIIKKLKNSVEED